MEQYDFKMDAVICLKTHTHTKINLMYANSIGVIILQYFFKHSLVFYLRKIFLSDNLFFPFMGSDEFYLWDYQYDEQKTSTLIGMYSGT